MAAKIVVHAAAFICLIATLSYLVLFLGGFEKHTAKAEPINVACVGDSITEWSGYPTNMQTMLGTNYSVGNFGVSGAAVSADWFLSYAKQEEFNESKSFQPSIVVIMLGTNDAHSYQSDLNFAEDYRQLISEYQNLDSKPTVYVVKPPPIYDNKLELSEDVLEENVLPAIEQVADELNLYVVDINAALANHPEYFQDGVHPNTDGAMAIAEEIAEAIIFEEYT